ncbi:MAG: hypothetical protein M5U11_00535 [Anaerolineales bacterium]|nr:hypothetical protein [Anaerolineales bacterium]
MAEDTIFQALPTEQIKELTNHIEIGVDLIVVTLIYGDEIIGALEKHWGWNGKNVTMGFNTKAGRRFGSSHIVEIPLEIIADISSIPLADDSIPKLEENDPHLAFLRELGLGETADRRLFVQDYPNPIATILESHNLPICISRGLKLFGYAEAALSREAIPPEGIMLKRDFILYTDWEFFSRQLHGAVTVNASAGVASISKDLSPSLQTFVFKHLRDNFRKIKQVQGVLEPAGLDEAFIQGCFLVPDPSQDTEIEGERCILVYCANAKNVGEAAYPVLIKQKSLKFPIEFLGLIRSPLIFYGEFLPIPFEVFGEKQEYTILARAIGYLQ